MNVTTLVLSPVVRMSKALTPGKTLLPKTACSGHETGHTEQLIALFSRAS